MLLCWHPCLPTMYISPLQGCEVSIYLCRDAFLRLGKPAGLHQTTLFKTPCLRRRKNASLQCLLVMLLCWHPCLPTMYTSPLQGCGVSIYLCRDAFLRFGKQGGDTWQGVTPLTLATRDPAHAFAPAVPARLARLRLPSLHIPRRWRLPALPPCGLLAAGG